MIQRKGAVIQTGETWSTDKTTYTSDTILQSKSTYKYIKTCVLLHSNATVAII